MLENVGSVDPQVALLFFRQCGSLCNMIHLAHATHGLMHCKYLITIFIRRSLNAL